MCGNHTTADISKLLVDSNPCSLEKSDFHFASNLKNIQGTLISIAFQKVLSTEKMALAFSEAARSHVGHCFAIRKGQALSS